MTDETNRKDNYVNRSISPISKRSDNTQISSKIFHKNNLFIISKIKQKQKWDTHEDKKLLEVTESYKEKNWKKISEYFNKSPIQCYSRYKRIRKGLIKGRWTPLEDRLILDFVTKYGKNWSFISKQMMTRTGKQIRDRYLNCLDPNVKRLKFSDEEDHKIISLYCSFGPKWSDIAKFCCGRTADMIKNRFYSKIKKQIHSMNNKKELFEFNKEVIEKILETNERSSRQYHQSLNHSHNHSHNPLNSHNLSNSLNSHNLSSHDVSPITNSNSIPTMTNSGLEPNPSPHNDEKDNKMSKYNVDTNNDFIDDDNSKKYYNNIGELIGFSHQPSASNKNNDVVNKMFDYNEKEEECDIVSYYNSRLSRDIFDEYFTYEGCE